MSAWSLLLILSVALVGIPLGIVAALSWLERVANYDERAKKPRRKA